MWVFVHWAMIRILTKLVSDTILISPSDFSDCILDVIGAKCWPEALLQTLLQNEDTFESVLSITLDFISHGTYMSIDYEH